MQLLHILDKRFFASSDIQSYRPELLGMITASRYSNLHVLVSEELAFANPELTLPFFCGELYKILAYTQCTCLHCRDDSEI